MSNFVYDMTSLPGTKSDLIPIPPGADLTKYLDAVEFNTLVQASYDIREVLRNAAYLGLMAHATAPTPIGIDNFVWLKDDGTLYLHFDGVDYGLNRIGEPTDGSYLDGFNQDLTPETTIADAIDGLNETILALHPMLPRLGEHFETGPRQGDGRMFAPDWAGMTPATAPLQLAGISTPDTYSIGPFTPGDLELVSNHGDMTFRTRGPVGGLTVGTRLHALITDDDSAWASYGTDLVLDGTLNPQSNGTWRVYGNPDGTGNLRGWPAHNGDISGYVECRLQLWGLDHITTTPDTGPVDIGDGPITITAVGYDDDGGVRYDAAFLAAHGVWASSDPTHIHSDGAGVFSLVGAGSADLTVTYNGVTGTAHITVTAELARLVYVVDGFENPSIGYDMLTTSEKYDSRTGLWTYVASLPTGQHRIVGNFITLHDGRLLLVSGKDNTETYFATALLYDPTLNTWVQQAMNHARANAAVIELPNQHVLAAGGTATGGSLTSCEEWDGAVWNNVGSMVEVAPGDRTNRDSSAVVLMADGKVMILGGASDGSVSQRVDIYDPATQLCIAVANFPTHGPDWQPCGGQNVVACLYNDQVFAVGGWDNMMPSPCSWIYDGSVWVFVAECTVGHRAAAVCVLTDGRVLVAGGRSNMGSPITTAEAFNGTAWSAIASMNHGRYGYGFRLIPLPNNRALAIGGQDVNDNTIVAELYDGTLNTWTDIPAPQTWRTADIITAALV